MHEILYKDLGLIDYKKAWDYQENIFNKLVNKKLKHEPNDENVLIFCEHPHVYTLGKSGKANNLLIPAETLKKIQASYYVTNRGGDITYHGPGQIVGYPIFDLESFQMGIKEYIEKLEEVIIESLKSYGISSGRLKGATGVWIDGSIQGKARKICAIGVKASRFVTMHGFAFNVNTDLNYFNYINPCGFVDKGVTSLQKELGRKLQLDEVKEVLFDNFKNIFKLVYTNV